MAKEQTIAGQNEEIQTRGVCAGCQRPQETEPHLAHAGGHAGPRANRAGVTRRAGATPLPPSAWRLRAGAGAHSPVRYCGRMRNGASDARHVLTHRTYRGQRNASQGILDEWIRYIDSK